MLEVDLVGRVFSKSETPYEAGKNWDAGISRQVVVLDFQNRTIQTVKFKGEDGRSVFDKLALDQDIEIRCGVSGKDNGRLDFKFVGFLKPAAVAKPA